MPSDESSEGSRRHPARNRIQSDSNQYIKRARSLLRRKHRYQERAFIVEGVRGVSDALGYGASPEIVLVSNPVILRRLPRVDESQVREVDDSILANVSSVETTQGVLAIFAMPDWSSVISAQSPARDRFWVICDGIRDPGNLGTLMRSAAAAGASGMIVSDDTVDPYNPKAVRSAMGAHFRLPTVEMDYQHQLEFLSDFAVVGIADASGELEYTSVSWGSSVALVIGSEAHGPSSELRLAATATVRIPLLGDVESLNAGVAGSLLMFEVARHRRGRK